LPPASSVNCAQKIFTETVVVGGLDDAGGVNSQAVLSTTETPLLHHLLSQKPYQIPVAQPDDEGERGVSIDA